MSFTRLSLGHFLSVGAIVFALSVIGIFLNRKNIIVCCLLQFFVQVALGHFFGGNNPVRVLVLRQIKLWSFWSRFRIPMLLPESLSFGCEVPPVFWLTGMLCVMNRQAELIFHALINPHTQLLLKLVGEFCGVFSFQILQGIKSHRDQIMGEADSDLRQTLKLRQGVNLHCPDFGNVQQFLQFRNGVVMQLFYLEFTCPYLLPFGRGEVEMI